MRTLIISMGPPYPPTIGGNQRINILFRALSRHGTADLFLAQDSQDLPLRHLDVLREKFNLVGCQAPVPRGRRWPWRLVHRLRPSVVNTVAVWWGRRCVEYLADPLLSAAVARVVADTEYAAIFIKGLSLAMKTGLDPDYPCVLDVDDVELEWYQSQMDNPFSGPLRRTVATRRYRELQAITPSLYARFKYVWVAKEGDRQFAGLESARVIGVPYYSEDGRVPSFAPSREGSKVILMVGSYYHRPNREGLTWFLANVWPRIRRRLPEAEFRVAGAGLPDRLAARFASIPGVSVLGMVEDLAAQYGDAAITVAPILSGAGMNLKVLESLIHSRTCVVTPYAGRGYETTLRPGEALLVGRDAEDFAARCVALLEDPTLRDNLAHEGQHVASEISFRHYFGIVDDTLAAIEGDRSGGSQPGPV